MAVLAKDELKIDHFYDRLTCRQYLNGVLSVLHCHHYSTLYTQLAEDVEFIDAKTMLAECAEDSFFDMLEKYFKDNNVKDVLKKITFAEQYFAAVGMGKMKVNFIGPESGEVELTHSHVDEGWKKKWGEHTKPVNHIARGYIAAMFSLFNDQGTRQYTVVEAKSIVMGHQKSLFNVVKR